MMHFNVIFRVETDDWDIATDVAVYSFDNGIYVMPMKKLDAIVKERLKSRPKEEDCSSEDWIAEERVKVMEELEISAKTEATMYSPSLRWSIEWKYF